MEGTSLITELLLLKKLASRFSNCNYFEIGSRRGESIANISDDVKKCTTISLSVDEMKSMNLSKEFINAHGLFPKHIKSEKHIPSFQNLTF